MSHDKQLHYDRYKAFHSSISYKDMEARDAVLSYTGSGYTSINKSMRYGNGSSKRAKAMQRAFSPAYTSPSPTYIERGKSKSLSWAEMNWEVGGVYADKGFWSGSVDRGVAGNSLFGGLYSSAPKTVYMRVHTHNVPSIPGTSGEYETILPPNTHFRVLAITDVMTPNGGQRRYIEAEVVT